MNRRAFLSGSAALVVGKTIGARVVAFPVYTSMDVGSGGFTVVALPDGSWIAKTSEEILRDMNDLMMLIDTSSAEERTVTAEEAKQIDRLLPYRSC